MKKKWVRITALILSVLAAVGVAAVVLVYNGVIILNGLSARKYEVRGVDVPAYQGEIDWQTLSEQDISFAFIKATEGSSFVDKRFGYNFAQAQATDLAVGAYHFFSYDSEGRTQAEHFIDTVEAFEGMLPPVVDLEFYGDKEKNPPEREYVDEQLKTMLSMLEEHYGQKPIIYATETSYELYLSGDYGEYDIWIRNVITRPRMSDGRRWTFWQYTNRERLDGYNGDERYIDVNVFNGGLDRYKEYLNKNSYKPEG